MIDRMPSRAAIFLVLALASFLLSMNTAPRLAWIPVIAAIGCAVLAVVRGEHGWGFAPLVAMVAMAFYLTADHGEAAPGVMPSETVRLDSWDWRKINGPADRSRIAWSAQISNVSSSYVESVRLAMTTFDNKGEVVLFDFGYASALAPGEVRRLSRTADAQGAETEADVRVAEVIGRGQQAP